MKRLICVVAVGLLLALVSDVEACGGCRGRGLFRGGRIGNGRILDRVRDRFFGPRHEGQKDDKGCPKCDPKKSGEAEWPDLDSEPNNPEELLAPKRVAL